MNICNTTTHRNPPDKRRRLGKPILPAVAGATAHVECWSAAGPVADPVKDPVAYPVANPVENPAAYHAVEPVVESAVEPVMEPAAEPAVEPVVDDHVLLADVTACMRAAVLSLPCTTVRTSLRGFDAAAFMQDRIERVRSWCVTASMLAAQDHAHSGTGVEYRRLLPIIKCMRNAAFVCRVTVLIEHHVEELSDLGCFIVHTLSHVFDLTRIRNDCSMRNTYRAACLSLLPFVRPLCVATYDRLFCRRSSAFAPVNPRNRAFVLRSLRVVARVHALGTVSEVSRDVFKPVSFIIATFNRGSILHQAIKLLGAIARQESTWPAGMTKAKLQIPIVRHLHGDERTACAAINALWSPGTALTPDALWRLSRKKCLTGLFRIVHYDACTEETLIASLQCLSRAVLVSEESADNAMTMHIAPKQHGHRHVDPAPVSSVSRLLQLVHQIKPGAHNENIISVLALGVIANAASTGSPKTPMSLLIAGACAKCVGAISWHVASVDMECVALMQHAVRILYVCINAARETDFLDTLKKLGVVSALRRVLANKDFEVCVKMQEECASALDVLK